MLQQGTLWQHHAVLPADSGVFQAAAALSRSADAMSRQSKAPLVQVVHSCTQPIPNIAVLPVDRGPHPAARAQGRQPARGACPGAAGAEPGPGCSGVAEEYSSQGAGGAGCPADSQCQLQVSRRQQAGVDCINVWQLDACQQVVSQQCCFQAACAVHRWCLRASESLLLRGSMQGVPFRPGLLHHAVLMLHSSLVYLVN